MMTVVDRRTALSAMAGGFAAFAFGSSPGRAATTAGPTNSVRVPFDHDAPATGSFDLPYVALRAFDARKPTVVVVTDGQQFFVTAEAFRPTTEPLFDERFNVVGVYNRGRAPAVQSRVGSGASTNWPEAYRLLCARQCIGDIEALRRTLLGPSGRVSLYGRSGGAAMAHQYAARYGEHLATMLTQAAVDNDLETAFGLESDHFWDEIAPDERAALSRVLAEQPSLRPTVIAVLQRQNFFVDRAHLAGARHELIASLAARKRDLLDRAVVDYQVAAIANLERSPLGPSIAVRLFELAAPFVGRYDFTRTDRIWPDHEAEQPSIAPLVAAAKAGSIPLPARDHTTLHGVNAQVTMLAGRWDHTCDYRSQIALASCYPFARLFVLDEDHTFHRLAEGGKRREVTIGALSPRSTPAYRDAVATLQPLMWREQTGVAEDRSARKASVT